MTFSLATPSLSSLLSSTTTPSFILLTVTFALSYFLLSKRRKLPAPIIAGDGTTYRHPPCLPTVPIFGSMPFMPAFPTQYKYFTKMREQYGDVFAYYMMGKYQVILNSKEAIHEAFVKRSTDFADRPRAGVTNVLNPRHKGILFRNYDDNFKKYHKLSLGIMKQFGFGNRVMETRIMEEMKYFMENLASFEGCEFNPTPVVTKCSMNIVCGILFGKRFNDDDPDLSDIIANIRTSFNNIGKIFMVNAFPFLRHFSFHKKALQSCVDAQNKIFKMLEQKIVECTVGLEFAEEHIHKESTTSEQQADENNYDIKIESTYYNHHQLQPKDDQGDQPTSSFIRSYIELEGPNYDKEQLLHFMRELFLAGTETTASTLEWTLVLLANHPDVQEKMFKELERVLIEEQHQKEFSTQKSDENSGQIINDVSKLASDSKLNCSKLNTNESLHQSNEKVVNYKSYLPFLEDKKCLPYCDAVFNEILRYKPVAPMTLPHVTMKDSHVMGFFVPKGCTVFGNLHGAHHDPRVWRDPEKFNPERFLNENNEMIVNKEHIVSFSLGKRSCFGEILARQEFFLSLTNLVWRFKIFPPEGQEKVNVDDVMDVTVKPSSFKIRLIERF
ncbi:hypothetical protein HELRODRAFT_109176 [Helobdella robusta]|uniref:Cytochrome P450 n=1 Tax=Helobdella robusta TaxID=6412 RepID=T1EER0_HELRO|nr:hypothetical protein HELRODRAFT_109176 [Helobdella robusta]ESO10863.1 hypothetical protein HELRODRAFT_109176 [Helobdella robusta]